MRKNRFLYYFNFKGNESLVNGNLSHFLQYVSGYFCLLLDCISLYLVHNQVTNKGQNVYCPVQPTIDNVVNVISLFKD